MPSDRSRSESNKRARKERTNKESKEKKEKKDGKRAAARSPTRTPSPPASTKSQPGASAAAASSATLLEQLVAGQDKILQRMDSNHTEANNSINRLSDSVQGLKIEVKEIRSDVADVKQVQVQQADEISDVIKRLTHLEVSNKELKERLAVAESAEPPPRTGQPQFDRTADPTVLKANCKSNVSKNAVSAAIRIIGGKAKINPKMYFIVGDPVSKFFTIRFKGTPTLAQEYAKQLLGALQSENEEGRIEWERVLVKDPAQSLVQLYIGPDKSPKQIRTETLSKRLGGIIEGLGHSQVDVRRRQGEVLVDWQPLAMVEVNGPEDVRVLWDNDFREKLGIDKDAVTTQLFTWNSPNRTPVPWAS